MTVERWIKDGLNTLNSEKLSTLQRIMASESALIVEHRFFRGSRSPHRFICEDPEELAVYLHSSARPGDAFFFWRIEQLCSEANIVARAKMPNADGEIPEGGAY